MNSIIAKYLTKNILLVFLAIFFIIGFLIIGNIFTTVLKSSLDQNLDIISLLILVMIKSLLDIPLIINLSFFLAIIIAIGKMYKESEIAAISSAGVGTLGMFVKILPLIITIASIVFAISMFLVPYSNIIKEQILQKNANTSAFHFIKTNQFQKFQGGNIVLYAEGGKDGSLGKLFVYSKAEGDKYNTSITLAEDGSRYQDGADNVYIRLKNGARYEGFLAKQEKKIFDFSTLDIKLINNDKKQKNIKVNVDGKNITQLMTDLNSVNIAEIWWRISLPISLIIMTFIGILFAKSPPRGGKNLGVLYGIIVFAIYLNILKIYKKNIINEEMVLSIAVLTPHLIFLIMGLLLYFYHNGTIAKLFK